MEEEIAEVYVFRMEEALRKFRQYIERKLKQEGVKVTVDQWFVLKSVVGAEGCAQKDIARYTAKDPASVTRLLDALENMKLVKRKIGKQDRRVYEVYLTEKGRKRVEKIAAIAKEARQKGLEDLTAYEKQVFKAAMDKMLVSFS